ncbi:MAG TPA: hypothetical protein VNK46_14440 [Nitrospiraceae bacterium]|jgi:hypothetical protein|nr:hypothetical protein [Nitrospiraceae bacterium]
MNTLRGLTLGVAALALAGIPLSAQAQIAEVNQAIMELTDPPALGQRTTVDLNKRWGSDVTQIKKAAVLLREALNKTTDPQARAQLDLAVDYAEATLHKEARLSAQGALYYLCKQAGGQPADVCDKVPKFGSYVAP